MTNKQKESVSKLRAQGLSYNKIDSPDYRAGDITICEACGLR